MKAEERQLKYFLNYVLDQNDVFIRAEAILKFKNDYIGYWRLIDKKRNSNYLQIIRVLYLTHKDQTLKEAASTLGLHTKTLRRYRDKLIKKMEELMKEYQCSFLPKKQ